MWLDLLIIEIKELEMIITEKRWDLEYFESLKLEYLSYGRDFLIKKYSNNLTYVYKLLNTEILKEVRENYQFVKEKYDHKQCTLELITFFHPEKDLIDERYYVNEEERLWKEAKMASR